MAGSGDRLDESERLTAQGRGGRRSATAGGIALVEVERTAQTRLRDDEYPWSGRDADPSGHYRSRIFQPVYGYGHEHLFAGEIAVDSEEYGHRRGSIRGQCERRNEDNRYCHWNCSRGSSRSPGRYEEYRWVLVLLARRRRIVPFLVREAPLPIVPAAWGDGLRRTESLIERYRSALPAILRVVSPAKAGPPSTIPAHLPSRFLTSQTRFHALSPCPLPQT